MKIGIIREGKVPHDKRVPLTPQQCLQLQRDFPQCTLCIEPSPYRCYSNEEYEALGLTLSEDLSDCDLIIGIKEVPKSQLIPQKKYVFFSHTIKRQKHNREMLIDILQKNIELIDYERLTDENQHRIIGFGRHAGIVGTYNGILGYGKKYDLFDLKRAHLCHDYSELEEEMKKVRLSNIKILLTGDGRVANGAIETLGRLKIRKVTPFEFLNYSFREPVYAQLHSKDYHEAIDGSIWNTADFYANPQHYRSTFLPYTAVCDLLLHCSFWDSRAPALFTKADMRSPEFRISVIADISCDVNGAIPSTLWSSSIEEPFYGYNPSTELTDLPFNSNTITIMAVDNLPCELPRDASEDFGKNLLERVFPALLNENNNKMIARATIAKNGQLMPPYAYLSDFVSDIQH